MEDIFIALMDFDSRLNLWINDRKELLDSDELGNPIYPDRGMPEYQYSPDAEDFSRKTKIIEEVLYLCQETLKKFMLSLSVADQHIVTLEARTTFLKNPNVWEADYRVPDDEENKADDNTVIINNEEETPQVEDVTQDQEDVKVKRKAISGSEEEN